MLRTATDGPICDPYAWGMGKPSEPKHQGQFIRAWRKRAGLTQEQLANRMGIARSYVSHVEKGVRRYDQLFLEGAAPHLGCEPRDLLRPPTLEDELQALLGGLSPDGKKRALSVVKALKDAETL